MRSNLKFFKNSNIMLNKFSQRGAHLPINECKSWNRKCRVWDTAYSVINTKGNVFRVIRLDLKFHITNRYKKLITNYLRMYE